MFIFPNKKISKIANLHVFLNGRCDHKAVVGWGRKPSYFHAKEYAKKHNLQCISLEDGFIRSLGLGKEGYPPLSLVVDESGIYFDATQVSDLEKVIQQPENQHDIFRAKRAIQQILDHGITKYNQKFVPIPENYFSTGQHILVADQTFGDQSIQYAGANVDSFKAMLKVALEHHPDATIWVKVHPDVIAGKAKGHFSSTELQHPQIHICSENYNPIELLQYMDDVYVVSSQLGFEALLCGKTVHCFGVPWYAGWGLTQDQYAPIHILKGRRQKQKSLEHLFACAYFHYARYVSPITQQRCDLEEIIDVLIPNIGFQKNLQLNLAAVGFSRWKRKFIASFLDFPKAKLMFKKLLSPNKEQNILAWGKKAYLLKQKQYQNVMTVEDGFIRSLGLGAALVRPHSLVFDDVGIYYDATRASRLENLLNEVELNHEQILRSQKLIKKLVDLQISKYNVGEHIKLVRPENVDKVILVVGQVEDDMSIQLGGVDIKENLTLLQTVRANNPDSYIIYKPHPDVYSGLRVGHILEDLALKYANQIELKASILECFKICDEVHTITSLSGFEALLRGLKVYCYGLPFYAGWGLTQDRHICHRRKKQLTFEQLVYLSLIQYPVYNIEATQKMRIPLVTPEHVIDYLQPLIRQPKIYSPSFFSKVFTSFRRLRIRK
ncbi:capsular polysaccharide biosynthesis protein [Acinetobacter sp. MB5]|uniref:capsular polysaccharide biosynthesis protein n=1 Tax=Acinetobacter sp. MB5 TaxID=2069438 RepID=UPI000DD0BDF5|nr:capsular polysaccharide biosynthesis protein [Acinetobacter sp. MB5]